MPTLVLDSGADCADDLFMFVRCKTRHKDGKEHRYWSVVENVRVRGGRVVQRQVLYLTSPVLITTNKPFSEWGDVFSSAACVVTKRAEPSSTDSSIAPKSSSSTAKAIDSERPRSGPPNAPRSARAELPNPVLREDRRP